nr:hypothetical protein [Tanacetum cinerariifolium]
MLDFEHLAVRLTSPEHDLQTALMESRSFRDDVYRSLFQQSGSINTRGQSSSAGHKPSVSVHPFSTCWRCRPLETQG